MKSKNVKKMLICLVTLVFALSGAARGETHWNVQAVNEQGSGTHPDLQSNDKVVVEGIVLNRPDFMLDATPNEGAEFGPGAMWQMYIQGEGADHAGTAVWMGQCYDNLWGGSGTYTNQEWLDELYRLNHDSNSGYAFAPGDRVRVTGLLKFYNGKTNINERHNTNPDNDFVIELVEAGVGLPQPELITLNDVKDANDAFIFDSSRLTGCEYYQGRLVKVNDVNFIDANSWDADATLTITDGSKTFPVKLGIGYGIYPGSNNLTAPFDVVGIFDQEGSDTEGYRIWVTNYDGNGKVLTDRGFAVANLRGELNADGRVDFADLALLVRDWLKCVPGTGACGGNSN